ncbi:unnamed protein product [Urochloa humidicola]
MAVVVRRARPRGAAAKERKEPRARMRTDGGVDPPTIWSGAVRNLHVEKIGKKKPTENRSAKTRRSGARQVRWTRLG